MLFESNDQEYKTLSDGMYTSCRSFEILSPAYLFTNENHASMFRNIDFKDKKVLAVCGGSGDFLFNAKLFGAINVDLFDISMFAKYVYEIKYQALIHLNFKEFKCFFYKEKPHLDKDLAKKFKTKLSAQAAFILTRTTEQKHCRDWVFRTIKVADTYKMKSPYLSSEKNYTQTKNTLDKNHDFYLSDLKNLPEQLNKTYDIIYLSNINQYMDHPFLDNTENFKKNFLEKLRPYLNMGGKIICYQLNQCDTWCTFDPGKGWQCDYFYCKSPYYSLFDKSKDNFFTLTKTGR